MTSLGPGGLVLALDTATDRATVSLLKVRGGEGTPTGATDQRNEAPSPPAGGAAVLAAGSQPVKTSHARRLLVLMEEVLEEAEAEPADLRAIVVGRGPGTFTGVRLGVAVARAAALSLSIPVAGVTTLSALAAETIALGTAEGTALLVPVTDARRGEVFATVYAAPAKPAGQWRRVTDLFSCAPGDLEEAVRRRIPRDVSAPFFPVGPVAPGPMGTVLSPTASFLVAGQERLGEPGDAPEGERLVPWLLEALDAGQDEWGRAPGEPGSPESVVPVYVRAPDADLHITKMRDPWAS